MLEDGCIADETGTCQVCLCPHDEEIHAATLSIHDWMRHQVTRWMFDFDDIELDEEPIEYVVFEANVA